MKILEFINKGSLGPVGGPNGYVYTLYKEDRNEHQLYFLDDSIINEGKETNNKKNMNNSLRRIQQNLSYLKILLFPRRSRIIDNGNYDVVHFHNAFELYKYRKSLNDKKCVSVLTSHCPTLTSVELYDNAKRWEKIIFWPIFRLSRNIDYGAFKSADYIVFPCEEAEEPYAHAWKGFEKFKEKNKGKFKYLISGTYERIARESSNSVRTKLNIPEDAFIVSYVGRHNEIKGYDNLKNMAKQLLDKYENLYFLIAGKEEPLKGLNHSRWIEVGWTTDPHSYIAASDLFVLPNKETYFDLVMLEVLSLGKIVLASRTGGNKYFDNDSYPGIFTYENEMEGITAIESIMTQALEDIHKLEDNNRKTFLTQFNSDIFYKNYIKLMKEIYSENR